MKLLKSTIIIALLRYVTIGTAFESQMTSSQTLSRGVLASSNKIYATRTRDEETEVDKLNKDEIRRRRKIELFGLIGTKVPNETAETLVDQVLADPITKEPLAIVVGGPILGGQSSTGVKVFFSSTRKTYEGRSDTYYNLLSTSAEDESTNSNQSDSPSTDLSTDNRIQKAVSTVRNFLPGPVQVALSRSGILADTEYIPMRDLFTSPSVSFAYERGWRQGFASAGFPGADEEYNMVKEYFSPINPEVVVDMSCATGLFTRRLAKGNDYSRVIGCDYSDAMLMEARSRIRSDKDLKGKDSKTKLDLIRCDVGEIPMFSNSVDALHAGAAMHCWPDLDSALSEIHRVLKPGSRFFASTFLVSYFRGLQLSDGNIEQQQQAFQYFDSVEVLMDLLLKAGFEKSKIQIDVLGSACAIIKAEK